MFKSLHAAIVVALLLSATPAVAATKAPASPTQSAPLDLNTATAAQLNALPGIGDTRAAAIIAARPYASINDLLTKKVVTQAIFDKIKGSITVSGAPATTTTATSKTVTKAVPPAPPAPPASTEDVPPEPSSLIDLNTATSAELEALPGIGTSKAGAIIAARPFASTNDIVTKGIVSAAAFAKIKTMVEVSAPASSTAKPPAAGKPLSTAKQAELSRIKACGAQWRTDKAAGRIPAGQTWPKYWSACNTRLKAQGQ